MKILVTGSAGLLGSNLCNRFVEFRHVVVGTYHITKPDYTSLPHFECNLLDVGDVMYILRFMNFDVVVNCVGWPDVDGCQKDPVTAYELNVQSVKYLSRACSLLGTRLIHISTDHLFDGSDPLARETTPPCPVNTYGRSKLMGERLCLFENPDALIIRTNFFGWAPTGYKSTYADWLYTSLKDKKPIKLFNDYYFNPLEVYSLADVINKLFQIKTSGILNVGSSEIVSKYKFARQMAEVFGLSLENAVSVPLSQGEMATPRPTSLSLSIQKLLSLGIEPDSLKKGLEHLYNTRRDKK